MNGHSYRVCPNGRAVCLFAFFSRILVDNEWSFLQGLPQWPSGVPVCIFSRILVDNEWSFLQGLPPWPSSLMHCVLTACSEYLSLFYFSFFKNEIINEVSLRTLRNSIVMPCDRLNYRLAMIYLLVLLSHSF